MNKQSFLEAHENVGETYAGLVLGQDDEPDYHLFLLDEKPSSLLNWAAAVEWAETLEATIPSPRELSLLFANRPDAFEAQWHWSNSPDSANKDKAWAQSFEDGSRVLIAKKTNCRARAIRRVFI